MSTFKIHKFMPYPKSENQKTSCVKCGRSRSHWLHEQWEKVQKYKDKKEGI